MNSKDFLFDLQLFADGGATNESNDTNTASDGETADNVKSKGTDGKNFTEDDIQKRINDELAKAKVKWEKDYNKKAEKARKERERLSKLSDDERAKAELENSRKELEAKEAELTRKELKLEMVKVLSERNLPVEFMDYLVDADSESTLKRITTFEKAYKKAVEAGVNEKLKGKAPKAGGHATAGARNAGAKNGFFDAIYKNQVQRKKA